MPIATIDPTTGETVKVYDALSDSELEARIVLAAKAFPAFRATTFAQRAGILNSVAKILDSEIEDARKTRRRMDHRLADLGGEDTPSSPSHRPT